jgi:hypothetical protein
MRCVRSLVVLACAVIGGCGARSDPPLADREAGYGGLFDLTPGAGGSGGSGGSNGPGGSGGSPFVECANLALAAPIVPLPTNVPSAVAPYAERLPSGEVLVTFLEVSSTPGAPGALRFIELDPFAAWPPAPVPSTLVSTPVTDYVMGPGIDGPVALFNNGTDVSLLTQLQPSFQLEPWVGAPGPLLFVAGVQGRSLGGAFTETPTYYVLDIASYQSASLPQQDPPTVCTTTPPLGAAIPMGQGFLSALVLPNPPQPTCNPSNPLPARIVALGRYESPLEPGAPLEYTEGHMEVTDDTIVHVALAPAPFGAWELFQLAGDNARSPPPVVARRVDAQGQDLDQGAEPLPISPEGYVVPQLAATRLGDTLAVAWVDAIDPSSPTIVVQLVGADRLLGPSISISTSEIWQSGPVRMVASADGQSLLVAWEGGLDTPTIGLARIDCQ